VNDASTNRLNAVVGVAKQMQELSHTETETLRARYIALAASHESLMRALQESKAWIQGNCEPEVYPSFLQDRSEAALVEAEKLTK